jgi:hypothetical protein
MASSNPPAPDTKPQVPQARHLPVAPTNMQSLDMQFQSLKFNQPGLRPQNQQDLPIRVQYESNQYIPPSTSNSHHYATNLQSYSRPITSENSHSPTYPYQLDNMSMSAQNGYTGIVTSPKPSAISYNYQPRDTVILNPYESRNVDSSYGRANPNAYARNPYEEPSSSNREYQSINPYLNKK